MKKKEKFKKIFFVALLSIMLLNIDCINAIEFNPGSTGKDDEQYKDYTATLIDLQINSVMAFGFDDFSNSDEALTLIGSVRINKKIDDDNVEYLNELPKITLVDENNNIIAMAEVISESEYSMSPSDLYYVNLYELNIQEGKTYRLVATITDNDNNVITKDITYSNAPMISQGISYTMSYQSVNNILSINFSKIKPLKGDFDKNGVVNANDAAVALDLYKYGNVTQEDLEIGDMDNDNVINANDAALILDVYKYGN